jgi:hypothetical protein
MEYLRASDKREDEDERSIKPVKGGVQGQKKSGAGGATAARDIDDIPIKPSKAMVREEQPAE